MKLIIKIVFLKVILTICLNDNFFSLITALNKNFLELDLFLMDTVYLLQIIGKILIFGLNFNLQFILQAVSIFLIQSHLNHFSCYITFFSK
jgi:hypothetical protein